MVELTETTLAMAFAIIGVVFSIAWLLVGLYGINTLRDLRDELASEETSD